MKIFKSFNLFFSTCMGGQFECTKDNCQGMGRKIMTYFD